MVEWFLELSPIMQALIGTSFTYFVTLLPISINGLGLQELSMTAIFSSFGGINVGSAAAAALMVRTTQLLASIPGAVFLPDILGVRKNENVD